MCERKTAARSSILRLGGQAVDLEAAAVGEDRAVPAHEAVQAAQLGDQVVAGPQGEMIGVAEDDLRAGFASWCGRQTLDGGLGADRHEHRRFDDAVRRVQAGRGERGRRCAGVQSEWPW